MKTNANHRVVTLVPAHWIAFLLEIQKDVRSVVHNTAKFNPVSKMAVYLITTTVDVMTLTKGPTLTYPEVTNYPIVIATQTGDSYLIVFFLVCMFSSGNEDSCSKQGCKFCRCSELCVPPYMEHECDPGCSKHCDMIDACIASSKCVYNYNNDLCYDIDGNGNMDLDVCKFSSIICSFNRCTVENMQC